MAPSRTSRMAQRGHPLLPLRDRRAATDHGWPGATVSATTAASPPRPTVHPEECYFSGVFHGACVALRTAGLSQMKFLHILLGVLWLALLAALAAPAPQPAPDGGIPKARLGESTICCPRDSVTLDGWASIDPGGEIVEWQWDLNGDGRPERVTEVGEITLTAPAESKTYTVYLRVKDNDQNISAPESTVVHVMASKPRVSMRADTTIRVGVRLGLRPRATSMCGTIQRYEWDFDDDGTYEFRSSDDANTSKQYFRAGKYHARLRVVDSFGHEAGGMMTITVLPMMTAAKEPSSAGKSKSANPEH